MLAMSGPGKFIFAGSLLEEDESVEYRHLKPFFLYTSLLLDDVK